MSDVREVDKDKWAQAMFARQHPEAVERGLSWQAQLIIAVAVSLLVAALMWLCVAGVMGAWPWAVTP
jgi:hypothetical protein